jgi:hypothetical protein
MSLWAYFGRFVQPNVVAGVYQNTLTLGVLAASYGGWQ